jgi:hypothetical protein
VLPEIIASVDILKKIPNIKIGERKSHALGKVKFLHNNPWGEYG